MRIDRKRALKYAVLLVCLIVPPAVETLCQQLNKPITRDNLISSIKLGRRERKTAARYIELINLYGVDFTLTPSDEQKIRKAGNYLGSKGLTDLIEVIRNNYRVATANIPLSSLSPDDAPISFFNEIPLKGGSPQRLDVLMKAAGYTGPTAMAVLYVKSNDENQSEIFVGTRPDINPKNSLRLESGSEWMEFRGGEDTTRVYIFSPNDVKIDITYRPKSLQASPMPTANPGDVKIGALECLAADEDTGNSLRGATCIARNQLTKEEYRGNTNGSGLVILNVPYGSYIVTVQAPHYSIQVIAAKVADGVEIVDVRLQRIQ